MYPQNLSNGLKYSHVIHARSVRRGSSSTDFLCTSEPMITATSDGSAIVDSSCVREAPVTFGQSTIRLDDVCHKAALLWFRLSKPIHPILGDEGECRDERVCRYVHILDNGARRNEYASVKLGVEDNGSKPDEASFADSARSVNYSAVRQGCSLPDRDFCARQGMKDHPVLDIAVVLDDDWAHLATVIWLIGANDRIGSDKYVPADLYVPDHLGCRVHVGAGMDDRPVAKGIRSNRLVQYSVHWPISVSPPIGLPRQMARSTVSAICVTASEIPEAMTTSFGSSTRCLSPCPLRT